MKTMALVWRQAIYIIPLFLWVSASPDKDNTGAVADARNGRRRHSEEASFNSSSFSNGSDVVSVKSLLLFSKALHEIVESHCGRNVDDLELDTFQAYLNRQILKGNVQTVRHSLHFNKLFQGILECAGTGRPESLSGNANISNEEWYRNLLVIKETEDIELTTENAGVFNDKLGELTTTTTTQATTPKIIPSSSSTTVKPTSVTQQQSSEKRTVPTLPTTQKPAVKTESPKDGGTTSLNKDKAKPQKDKPTVISRLAHNATQLASNLLNSGKRFMKKIFKPLKFWRRRKRDTSGKTEKTVYYTNERIQLAPEVPKSSKDDSYGDIWKAVTAEENKKVASDHFSIIFKSFEYIVVSSCPKVVEEVSYLEKMMGLFNLLVESDLKAIEDSDKRLVINDNLQENLMSCVAQGLSQIKNRNLENNKSEQ